VTRKEIVTVFLMIGWVCAIAFGHQVFRGSGARMHGHRTGFWVAPLLLGVWLTQKRSTSLTGGALGGFVAGVFHSVKNILPYFTTCTVSAWVALRIGTPAKSWKGALKAVAVGVVCGVISFLGKGVFRFGFHGFASVHDVMFALFLYPTSGAAGGFSAWIALSGVDAVRKKCCEDK